MKIKNINKFKCKQKYNKRIKYIKVPINKDEEIIYNLDNINIHSSKVLSKEAIYIVLILLSGIFYFVY